jgi:cupin 2 domain-containing protein
MRLKNILHVQPDFTRNDELFENLLRGNRFRLERIVSTGQCTPAGDWYDQENPEWVMLLTGKARLRLDDDSEISLAPGDCLNIPAHCRHRVEWTDPHAPTVWLAIHYEE